MEFGGTGRQSPWATMLSVVASVVVATGLVIAPPHVSTATAVSAQDFKPGNIISDAVFFDHDAMDAAQVQRFLESKVKSCAAGYTCLKDYRANSNSRAKNPMCSAYSGAKSERASTIIVRVANACGINPRVLIVLLQKEQSLVTSTRPSSVAYKIATGYACPDTAPCDSQYFGFFNQVYSAAYQFKRYTNPPGTGPGTDYPTVFNWFPVGKSTSIRFHPNASCGSAKVTIQNKATASLYYYTPYQPNAAALAAGYGTGNSCSAYGNRNFFLFFSDWFGPTRFTGDEIAAYLADNPEVALQLGASTSAPRYSDSGAGGFIQQFANGAVFVSDRGVWHVLPPTLAAHTRRGSVAGALGWPRGAPTAYDDSGGGQVQTFEGGAIYSSGVGAYGVSGAVRNAYIDTGSISGELRWPSSDPKRYSSSGGGYVQRFQGGVIYHGSKGAFAVTGEVRKFYVASGSIAGVLKWPVGVQKPHTEAGGGLSQRFQGGAVYSSATGTYRVSGATLTRYIAAGGPGGSLGWPKGASRRVSASGGGTVQNFTGGGIYASDRGAYSVTGVVRSTYVANGSVSGVLRWPVAEPKDYSIAGGGTVQRFQAGAIYSSPSGSYAVYGAMRTAYVAAGSISGELGWPTGARANVGGAIVQQFQGGEIRWTKSGGSRVVLR